jgi:hypothetical protein
MVKINADNAEMRARDNIASVENINDELFTRLHNSGTGCRNHTPAIRNTAVEVVQMRNRLAGFPTGFTGRH